jgi:protein TonB
MAGASSAAASSATAVTAPPDLLALAAPQTQAPEAEVLSEGGRQQHAVRVDALAKEEAGKKNVENWIQLPDAEKKEFRQQALAAQMQSALAQGERDSQAAQRAGARLTNRMEGGGVLLAHYGALVSSAINRHKTYPAVARAQRQTGSVRVAFELDANGQMANFSITKSSGYSAIDEAAGQMMRATKAPPPPNGSFSGVVTLNFNMR